LSKERHKITQLRTTSRLYDDTTVKDKAEIRTLRQRVADMSHQLQAQSRLLTDAVNTAQSSTNTRHHPPDNASTRAGALTTVKDSLFNLKTKIDGSKKGTKLVHRLLSYLALAYTRVEDIPRETMTAYQRHVRRFPESHLRADHATKDITNAITTVKDRARTPGDPFISVFMDQLKRSQSKLEMVEKDNRSKTKLLREEESTSNRLRRSRARHDEEMDVARSEISSLTHRIKALSSFEREVTNLRTSNAGLTTLVQTLYDNGMQTSNSDRPSQHDVRYMRSLAVICANPDIVHWKWTMIMQGSQTLFHEFLTRGAARSIVQRSDQSDSDLPTGPSELRLTINNEPVDLLFCSYGSTPTDKHKAFIDLHKKAGMSAVEDDTDLGQTPHNKGEGTAVAGVMIGVTLRSLTPQFIKDNRSPFVRVFGAVDSFVYVLTADNFIPLRKHIKLKDLQSGYNHKPQGGSYTPCLGLTDEAYASLHGDFMSWTSTSMRTSGPAHPLLTGPIDDVMVTVNRHIRNTCKQKEQAQQQHRKRSRPHT
jgi:hypothetical protein